MTPILFIAHHFPPMGGPGVFRSLNFVKYLPEFGYKPIVFTISHDDVANSMYPADENLLDVLPEDVEIIRVSTNEPRKLKKILMKMRIFRIFWFLFYPYFWETSAIWHIRLLPVVRKIIKERKIEIIYTSSGPYSPLLLGAKIKDEFPVKWVADFRDLFTDSYVWLWPSKLHWYFCRRMEKKILKKADRIILNTPEAKKLFLKSHTIEKEKIHVITNGF